MDAVPQFPTTSRHDGRRSRGERSDAAILTAARALMVSGTLQPSMIQVAAAAGRSPRTVFSRFSTVEELRLSAVDDAATKAAIIERLEQVCGYDIALPPEALDIIIRALVTGRA